jgi:hypothetical protein
MACRKLETVVMEIFVLVVHFVLFQSIFLLFQQYIFIVLKSNLRKKENKVGLLSIH